MTTFIAGGYGCGNIGDDAMLQGLKNQIDKNAREIYVYRKTSIQAIYSKDVVDDLDGFNKIAQIGDVLILGGGSIFSPSESLETVWLTAQNAKNAGLKVEIRGVGIDELGSNSDNDYIEQLCEMASVIEVRTKESTKLLKKIGITKPIIVVPDYANYVEPDNESGEVLKNQLKFDNEYPLVGLSISLNTSEHNKIDLLIQSLRYILDSYKINIVAIPHTRHFNAPSENDYIPAEIIFSQLKRGGRYDVLPWGFTVEALLGLYGKLKACIGMRYHAFVFAHKMKVPLLGISRENKHKIYLEENGFPYVDWHQLSNAQPLTNAANRLIDSVGESINNNIGIKTLSNFPKISVIMPTYQHTNYIERSIYTLYLQTFKEWELIIVNDCSPDDTEERLSSYLDDSRIKYVKNKVNVGEWASVINALEHCDGKYIAYLHSDDIWYPNHLQVLYDYLEANPDKQMAYTAMHAWDKYMKHLEIMDIPTEVEISGKEKKMFERNNVIVPIQVMHLSSCFEKYKPSTRDQNEVNGDFYIKDGYKLWSKFLQDYNLGFVDVATAKWTTHDRNQYIPSFSPESCKEYYQRPTVKAKVARQLYKEIGTYLGLGSDEVKEKVAHGSSLLADEWRQTNPQTPYEVRQFYSQTENYIFDLAMWHQEPHVICWTRAVVEFCCQTGLNRILDYGCGIGEEGIALAKLGFDVAFVDVPSKTFDFTKWRVKSKKLSAKFIEVQNDTPLDGKYDVIICFEVLEHLWDPEAVVKHIYQHTASGGYFLATVSFNDEGNHPMHLQRNFHLQGSGFVEMMSNIGFQPSV